MIKKFEHFSILIHEDVNRAGSGQGIMREVDQYEADLHQRLDVLGVKTTTFANWKEPNLVDNVKKNQGILDTFFNMRPFINFWKERDFIGSCKKMVELTNIEILVKYFSILISEIDKIKELQQKLKSDKTGASEAQTAARAYEDWIKNLEGLKAKVESSDFLQKITPNEKELKVSYKKKEGEGNAEGDIKGFELEDGGGVKFIINNDKAGEIKKDITELLPPGQIEGEDEKNAQKKIGEIQNDLPKLKKIANYAEFLKRGQEPEIQTISDLIDDELTKLG